MNRTQLFVYICLLGLLCFTGQQVIAHNGHNHNHNHGGHGHNHDHSGHNHNHDHGGHGHNHDHSGHNHNHNHGGHSHAAPAKTAKSNAKHDHAHTGDEKLDLGKMILDHVKDANEWHLFGDVSIPLPCIVYRPEDGLDFFMSNKFHHGHDSYKGYVLDHGVLKYVADSAFPKNESVPVHVHMDKASKKSFVTYKGKEYEASRAGFFDFSITKIVACLMLTALIMFLIFFSVARAYKKRDVPSGLQSFMEPLILFVRDDIAVPNLGDKADKYMPYLLGVFFFIWIGNMLGLIPFIGSPNVTGNIAVTFTLAFFTFLITTFSGNKHYWAHIFNPTGVPFLVKLILIVIEVISIFVKPFALMIRLFANITGGHIIVLSLVGLIFVFAEIGGAAMGYGASIVSGALLIFMNFLELFVAALQAYVFTVLSAVFIGQAIEEHHHHDEAHAH